ncbi:MAG: copG family ribbon-helix-helix protein [uncultured archaeon A07HR67]|jgi:Ribbon-helix-helix protein, copG family.|nr:MAG: copG family ribbon-helix-helix protein [uncultured archaeon A07HR67]
MVYTPEIKPLTVRLRAETEQSLEEGAAESGVSVSEYAHELIEKGYRYDQLRNQLNAREDRIKTLEEQLAQRSQIEAELDILAQRVEQSEPTYAEKRQQMIDRASLTERLRWRVTGVPVDEWDAD